MGKFYNILKENNNNFVDIPSIDPNICCLKLNVDPSKWPPSKIAAKYHKTINAEIDKLEKVNFICDVLFADWLANIVVPKKNGRVRVCIDYTNLNKVHPKDDYPLLRIEQLVDGTYGHEMLSSTDGYSG